MYALAKTGHVIRSNISWDSWETIAYATGMKFWSASQVPMGITGNPFQVIFVQAVHRKTIQHTSVSGCVPDASASLGKSTPGIPMNKIFRHVQESLDLDPRRGQMYTTTRQHVCHSMGWCAEAAHGDIGCPLTPLLVWGRQVRGVSPIGSMPSY